MKYKENDEIWIKARVKSINSGTDRFFPYHVVIEANGKNSGGFLTYISISDKCETKPVEKNIIAQLRQKSTGWHLESFMN